MTLRLGYQVVGATSGVQALRELKSCGGDIDLLITDQTMPKMTGKSLIRRARKLYPGLPVILSTGFSGSASERERDALGIHEVLSKPITKRELAVAVRKAMDQ